MWLTEAVAMVKEFPPDTRCVISSQWISAQRQLCECKQACYSSKTLNPDRFSAIGVKGLVVPVSTAQLARTLLPDTSGQPVLIITVQTFTGAARALGDCRTDFYRSPDNSRR